MRLVGGTVKGLVWVKGHEWRREQSEMGVVGSEIVLDPLGQGKDLANPWQTMIYSTEEYLYQIHSFFDAVDMSWAPMMCHMLNVRCWAKQKGLIRNIVKEWDSRLPRQRCLVYTKSWVTCMGCLTSHTHSCKRFHSHLMEVWICQVSGQPSSRKAPRSQVHLPWSLIFLPNSCQI